MRVLPSSTTMSNLVSICVDRNLSDMIFDTQVPKGRREKEEGERKKEKENNFDIE